MPNSSLISTPQFVGGRFNRLKIWRDGTLQLLGDATVWEDLSGPLNGKNLYDTPGKVDYDFDEGCVVFQPSGSLAVVGDVAVVTFQVKHAAKADAPLHLHIHWEQPSSGRRTFQWTYRVQSNGAAKSTGWATAIDVHSDLASAFPYVSGTLNQITALGDVPLVGVGISGLVQVKITRTDATSGDINATYIDAHYQIDTLGSREEYVK
jgi:hypothetical protein